MMSAARCLGIATALLALSTPAAAHDSAPSVSSAGLVLSAPDRTHDPFVSFDLHRRLTVSEKLARRYPPAEIYRSDRFSIRIDRYRLEPRHADRIGYARPGRY